MSGAELTWQLVVRTNAQRGTAEIWRAFAAGPVQAQQGSVTGQVTDKSNQQPVAGASVLLVGTSLQGRTNAEGRYSIAKVPAGQYQVQVRLIGYATATQPITVAIFSQLGEFGSNIEIIAPAAFLSLVIPLAVFFAFQRYFVQGLLAGSIK